MEVTKFHIEGLLAFKPKVFGDDRGAFVETWNQKVFDEHLGGPVNFVQDNQSTSIRGVIRGLHFQAPPFAQGKLVRVTRGRVIDVALDIRSDSKTYGQYKALELSAENGLVFWIPEGFAHGFSALEDGTIFNYKCTRYYNRESEGSILWNDPDLGIDWKTEPSALSDKDITGQPFATFKTPF